jgi:hypothetical protein
MKMFKPTTYQAHGFWYRMHDGLKKFMIGAKGFSTPHIFYNDYQLIDVEYMVGV